MPHKLRQYLTDTSMGSSSAIEIDDTNTPDPEAHYREHVGPILVLLWIARAVAEMERRLSDDDSNPRVLLCAIQIRLSSWIGIASNNRSSQC